MNRIQLISLIALGLTSSTVAAEPFRDNVLPFVNQFCSDCHNQEISEGELDLTRYSSVKLLGDNYRQWEHVADFVARGEMPPKESEQPSKEQKATFIRAIEQIMQQEAKKRDGDPGTVLPRRLSNPEYNYTIRDLTGHDIRPAASFPIDPASGEGFNNTGEALIMSPSLFKKYYAAAEFVADHVLIKPLGFEFAPYRVVTYADKKKFFEGAIIDFYRRHEVNYEAYLMAAWEYQHRRREPLSTPLQWASDRQLSGKYLAKLTSTLNKRPADEFFLGHIQRQWQVALTQQDPQSATQTIRALSRQLKQFSLMLCPKETRAIVSNAGNPPVYHTDRRRKTASERDTFNESLVGNERQVSAEFRDLHKRDKIEFTLRVNNPIARDRRVVFSELNFSTQNPDRYRPNDKRNRSLQSILEQHAREQLDKLKPDDNGHVVIDLKQRAATNAAISIKIPTGVFGKDKRIFLHAKTTLEIKTAASGVVLASMTAGPHVVAQSDNAFLSLPLVDPAHREATERLRVSCRTFCALFPNRFFYVDGTRGLSAGFHLIEGFFRDDQPLCKLVLNDEQNKELNRLWDELNFGTGITERRLRGFVFFERSERNFMKHPDFDSIKEEDPKLTEPDTLARFEQIYLARSNVRLQGEELAKHPVSVFFEAFRVGLERERSQWQDGRSIYLKQLQDLAASIYRRPLTGRESEGLETFYETTCDNADFSVEQAVRATVIRLLVSPCFCYRMDLPPMGSAVKPISNRSLASRLSYFLWSSMPDVELSELAEAGRLHDRAVLKKQLNRMLADPKISAFALEFFGQWLGHRDFLQQESVNRDVYRDFDDALKQAMFEEPTRVITHLIQNDRPVTDLLGGDTTFVNARLAAHYGVRFEGEPDQWAPVTDMSSKGRRGLLGMAVFLTKNSQPERTSPVKRGFWVFHKVLGQHIPPPPPDVAVLPAKETDTGGKTIRELLKLHTDDAKCARCHVRFDPIGLSMEGFDAIGKTRSKDLAGREIDNAVFLDGKSETGNQKPDEENRVARGVPEFAEYLAVERRDDFVRTLCRKFLGYALERSLILSDRPLLDKMQRKLKEQNYRFSALFETVVMSPQFLTQRGREYVHR
ncbi:MAG: hypothetical protein CMJ78_21895 [Planctomycetaceae bacterium]|nr:hypothetical protein [Planctomycetaceae bacterium]